MSKPSEQDVAAFIALKKSVLRIMEWTDRPSIKIPQWKQFESRCYLGSTLSDEVTFRAHYRPAGLKEKGVATIEIPEAFYVSLALREHRVVAIDTLPGQKHTNRVVQGRPLSGQKIDATTHWHVWTIAGDGYVEPIEPPVLELADAIAYFCQRVNLKLNGAFKHPMYGQSGQLL
jgi:hypothetical protein